MLSTPGDFPASRIHTASSNSSLYTGRLSASCMEVLLLCFPPGCFQFHCCRLWLLTYAVGSWQEPWGGGGLQPFIFPDVIPFSMLLRYSPVHSFFLDLSFFLMSQFSLFWTLVLLKYLCTAIVSATVSGRRDPENLVFFFNLESSSSVFQGPLQLLRVAFLLDCSLRRLHCCQGHIGLQTFHLLSLEHFHYLDARALPEVLCFQLQLDDHRRPMSA